MKKRLGINIDHVATVRNARGSLHPDPLTIAKQAMECKADSITIHLREDRRHIRDLDVVKICNNENIPTNLEISLNNEIFKIALKNKPNFICIVPENRKEITTEGGLNLNYKKNFLKKVVTRLKKNNSRVSLFIEPNIKDIKNSKDLGVDGIEFHTGKICNLINQNKSFKSELFRINKAVNYATSLGLDVHAGHGLTYKSAKIISRIKKIKELNIGHFLIGESIFMGLPATIKKFIQILK